MPTPRSIQLAHDWESLQSQADLAYGSGDVSQAESLRLKADEIDQKLKELSLDVHALRKLEIPEIQPRVESPDSAVPAQFSQKIEDIGVVKAERIEQKESDEVKLVAGETFQSTCARCRKPFQSKHLKFESAGVKMSIAVGICPQCDADIQREEKLAEQHRREQAIVRNARARDEAWAKWCPKEFRLISEGEGKTELARLEIDQPKVKELLAWKGPRGLIIRGVTGTCKTRSMWRLIRRLYVEGKTVTVLTAAQFDRECRDAGGNFTLTDWFNRLAARDVLVLDDLGKHPWTPATEATWFDLVDERTREDKPIIVTTNDTGDSLASRMAPERAEPLIRRLRDFCEMMIFT